MPRAVRSLTWSALLAVAALVAVPLGAQEQSHPDDLLFRASFDRLTAFADFARGKPDATLDVSLELRAKPGMRGHCLLVEEGEHCVYEAEGNIELSAATVSLWVKPANWTDEDRRYVAFFNVYGRIPPHNKGFGLTIDKSDAPGSARLHCSFGSRSRDSDYRLYITVGHADWDGESWHKLDATWNSTHLAIYVDGKLSSRQDLPDVQFPELVNGRIELARSYGVDMEVRSDRDRTYIDEVQIYRGVHSPERIMERYLADRPDAGEELPVPRISVPRAPEVTVDGRLDEPTWERAARVPIMVNIRNGLPHVARAYASVCYGPRALYLGLRSDKHRPELVAEASRDGPVWEDDAFEVLLHPGEEASHDFHQLIINSAGALFDARGGDSAWDAPGVTVATDETQDAWTAEVAVPYADLGAEPPAPGQMWRGNFCRDWFRPDPQDPVYTTWAYGGPSYLNRPERFGVLTFASPDDGVGLTVAGGLGTGRVALEATSARPARLEVAVSADGTDLARELRDLDGTAQVQLTAREVTLAELRVTVTDPEGGPLYDYRTRFLVKRPIAAAYVPDVAGGSLGMELDLTNLDPEWLAPVKAGAATLDIVAEGAEGDRGEASQGLAGPEASVALPLRYREGTYEITYVLRTPGRDTPLVVTDSLRVPNLDWVGSNVGVSEEVLDPWTPLEYRDDRTVACWGRSYEFAGPFPARVVGQGTDLLRGPVSLTLETDTGQADLAETSRACHRRDAHRAEFSGEAAFGDLGARVEWSAWMEYDGLAVGMLTIAPPAGGLEVRSLTLRIPLREGLRHIRGARKNPNRMPWDFQRWESGFEPFIWMTSEEDGFLYFCNSEANWVYPRGEPVTLITGGPEPTIELRIIAETARVEQPLTYQFGFQGTPVKPLQPGWREMNFGPGLPIKHQTHQPWMAGYAYHSGLWEAPRPEKVREFNDERWDKGVLTFFYATTSCTPNHNPVYRLFRTLWDDPYPAQFGPYDGKGNAFKPDAPTHHLVPVCPGAPTLVEYELWLARTFHEQTGATGFYTDTDGIWPCENRRHGCGFTDVFGRSGVSYALLKKRRFAQRMATLMRQIKRDGDRGYWMTHCHSKLVPFIHCFADFFWPGEEYTHRLYGNKWFYMDTMDELDWRAQLTNNTSGLVHIFLPEFKRGTRDPSDIEQPQPTESLLAMCAVNDVNTSAAYMHLPTMVEWWGLRKRLGLADAQFAAYWREGCPVRAVTERSLASLYYWPDRAAVPVANRLERDTEVRVEVDLDALGLGARPSATDERTGGPVALRDGGFTVTVPARSYTFVSLRPAE